MPAQVQVIDKRPSALHFLMGGLAKGQEQSRVAQVLRDIELSSQSPGGAIGGQGGLTFPTQTPSLTPMEQQGQAGPVQPTPEQRLATAQRMANKIMMSPHLTPEQREQALRSLDTRLQFEKQAYDMRKGARQEGRLDRQEDRLERGEDRRDREIDQRDRQLDLQEEKDRREAESNKRKAEYESIKTKVVHDVVSNLPDDASAKDIVEGLTGAGIPPKEAREMASAIKKEQKENKTFENRIKQMDNAFKVVYDGIKGRYKVSVDGTLQFENDEDRKRFIRDTTRAEILHLGRKAKEHERTGRDAGYLYENIDEINRARAEDGLAPVNPSGRSNQNLQSSGLKRITKDEARALFEEADGDTEKAKRMAKERGIDIENLKE